MESNPKESCKWFSPEEFKRSELDTIAYLVPPWYPAFPIEASMTAMETLAEAKNKACKEMDFELAAAIRDFTDKQIKKKLEKSFE